MSLTSTDIEAAASVLTDVARVVAERDRLQQENGLLRREIEERNAQINRLNSDSMAQDIKAANLRSRVSQLEDEVARAGIWAANLSMHAHDVKRKAEDFIRGVSATTWNTREPRVIGFKLEFDAMVTAVAQPTPTLPDKA